MRQSISISLIICILIACGLIFGYFSKYFQEKQLASYCKCSPFPLLSDTFVPGKDKYRVANGKLVTNPEDFPYTAAIILKIGNLNVSSCTGSVITPSFVLTAANCLKFLYRIPQDHILVASGLDHNLSNILNSPDNIRDIKKMIMHSAYFLNEHKSDKNYPSYDIGLIELNVPFKFNEKTKIYPACLYSSRDYNSSYLVTAGYGTESYEIPEQNKTHSVNSTSESSLTALNMIQFDHFIDLNHSIKFTSLKSSICSGDSGSGIGHVDSNNRYFLIGISTGNFPIKKDNKTYYDCAPGSWMHATAIQYYMDFIWDNVSDNYNLCQTRFISFDQKKILIYWFIAALIMLIVGVALILLFKVKINLSSFTRALSSRISNPKYLSKSNH